jgi:5-oxoprolinase (ATP-hydrolysing) subunit A
MPGIDLNCDMGEGFPYDADIMPFISSVNIACGYHAGDTDTMKRTVELALQYGVAIGAHPSYPDRENFGRIDMVKTGLQPKELAKVITEQILQLQKICHDAGATLHHVKPHGALYNRAAWDHIINLLIGEVIMAVDDALLLYGLSNSTMEMVADAMGLGFVNEAFADRTYQDDGSLTPRTQPNALIVDTAVSIQQVLQMIRQGTVQSVNGKEVPVLAETICIHGDGVHAAEFARAIHEALMQQHISVAAP